MANIANNSMAAAVGAGVQNVVHKSAATVMPRKLLIIATQLQAYMDCAPIGKPILVTSPEDVTGRSGFGTMAHRLALAAFRGTKNSVPVYLLLQEEPQAAQNATGEIAVTADTPHADGVLALYVAGKAYKIPIVAADDAAAIGGKIEAYLNRDLACPVVAANAAGTVTLTAKSKGPWGNGITVAVNQRIREDEKNPDGVYCAVTAMSGGAGLPDLEAALKTGLGDGDSANEAEFTAVIHGYGKDSQVLNALSQYVGEGNEFSGLYQRTIARPFRSMIGSTDTGSAGLQAAIEFTDTRKNDRCNGLCCKPGSLTHPQEIAAELMGAMEEVANSSAQGSYIGILLSGVDPGIAARDAGQDWTTEYTNRDLAVKSGISPLIVEGGSVVVQNVVSFYRPASIPEISNMYRRMRDISITQNILYNLKKNFSSAKWQGFTVVKDKSLVTNAIDRAKARDIDDVKDDDLALIQSFMSMAWLYDTEFSINALKQPDAVQVRLDGGGFNNSMKLIYSGEGGILDTICYIDTSIAVVAS
jgi:phage tail sheath gpL-like